jgi:GNAT superfamily N-acetyltransferase
LVEGVGAQSSTSSRPAPRQSTAADSDQVVELFTLAFFDDPTWSWAFSDPEKRKDGLTAFWGVLVHSGLRHGWTWMTADRGAASLWIPPGQAELSPEDEERVEPLLRDHVGDHADDVLTLLDRFAANHPADEPHYYLSLLGTHPDHRGHGKGMGLLAANLAQIDAMGVPTYLESSNRANDHRYERLGYRQIGEFAAPGGEPTLACMWRDPR